MKTYVTFVTVGWTYGLEEQSAKQTIDGDIELIDYKPELNSLLGYNNAEYRVDKRVYWSQENVLRAVAVRSLSAKEYNAIYDH